MFRQRKSQQTKPQQTEQTRSDQSRSDQANSKRAKFRRPKSRQRKYQTKEEVIAAFKECSQKVGHTPTYPEMRRVMKMTHGAYRRHFATFTQALEAAGMEPRGGGYKIPMEKLLEDWASVARKVGRCPTAPEYDAHAQYSLQPLQRRFGAWANVAMRMREYIERSEGKQQWDDVLALISKQQVESPDGKRRGRRVSEPGYWQKLAVMKDKTIYGRPLAPAGLAHAPVNEAGVLVLFGMLAVRLGFTLLHVQTGFPDCEALLEVEPDRWQRVRIEFEYRSRNFLAHGHDAKGCDLIVCWEHDWEDCPVRVLELKELLPTNCQTFPPLQTAGYD